MVQRRIARLFSARKGHLDYRIKRDYIKNGIATIPCRITSYDDVMSPYSVEGFETLNPDFVDYIRSTAEFIPDECPVVLNIIGDCLTQKEKQTIEGIIEDDFGYDLGIVEKESKRHLRTFLLMFVGLILFGLVLWLSEGLGEIPREIIFIMFWFMGDSLCDYVFLTGHDLRRNRKLAGRLASIKVVFSDRYEKPNYTQRDVEQLYSEIEKHVNESLQNEE